MEIFINQDLLVHMNALTLRFLEVGDVDTDPTWRAEGVCSSFSRLYLVTGGEGTVCTEEGSVTLMPGYAYLIPAGLRYSYQCGTHLEKLYFHFNLVRPDGYDYFNRFGKVAKVPLDLKDAAMLRRMFHDGDAFSSALTMELYVSRILSGILGNVPYHPNQPTKLSARTAAAVAYIRENLSAALTVQAVAQALFVSKGTLARTFREEVGCSVSQYIDDQIFRFAEEKLLYTGESVASISELCGFCDQFYFSRKFSERYGMSPSLYRQSYQTEK